MRKTTRLAMACGVMVLLAGACFAEGEQAKYFQLDFVVQELEGGKVTNSRHYQTTISTTPNNFATIRTGIRVPVMTGGSGTDNGTYSYVDVGVNIDCRDAKDIPGGLTLNVTADISSAATTTQHPVIRQNKWRSNVIVPIGKPTIIFSSDDVASKGQIRLELTATAIREH